KHCPQRRTDRTSISVDVHGVSGGRQSSSPIRLGLCAMAKKAKARYSEQPVEAWPVVDALISFYSHGFPLEKVAQYAELRKPFLVNDLISQRLLMNRQKVYERLREREIQSFATPSVIEATPATMTLYWKPKITSTAGGGSVRLFRKVGNCSSVYHQQESRVRRLAASCMRSSWLRMALTSSSEVARPDGKVERDPRARRMRCPTVCGFDLLRANGVSYVCDVNGFSFVKSSEKYLRRLRLHLGPCSPRPLRRLCPCQSAVPAWTGLRWVRTTFGHVMELRCLICQFYRLFNRQQATEVADLRPKLKKPAALQELLNAARSILMQAGHDGDGFKESPKEDRSSIEQFARLLEIARQIFEASNRKSAIKFLREAVKAPLGAGAPRWRRKERRQLTACRA
uniref:Inositol hexakisphosphate and diphosphoinositol-pentakisphosphate kinase n=1 Tax=Macrostomum lignano TaxID=282301 RepID=A0A1I8FGM5_9PLAT